MHLQVLGCNPQFGPRRGSGPSLAGRVDGRGEGVREGMDRRVGVVVTAVVVALIVAGGPWVTRPPGAPAARTSPTPAAGTTPRVSPTPTPSFELTVELGRVSGRGPDGRVRAGRLAGPAQAVLGTMTELYSAGFVDPGRWAEGRFPGLLRLFAREARRQARTDLGELTLGRAAARLDGVRPRRAKLDVRFLTDAARRPIVAFAEMDFAGTGLAEDAELPVRHRGRYVLRPEAGRWRIAAYDVRGRVPTPGQIRSEVRSASASPGLPSRDPMFVLVIGSDARPGQSAADARADSIHIVGIDPRRHRASIVGIPRDSYVPIPGAGVDKINAALVRGGPELLVATVERLAGLRVAGYVLTGFEGFERMVNAVGGLDVVVPYPMSDRFSHAQFPAGPTRLTGRRALAFARNRHDPPDGDLGRSLNQGRLLIAALREVQAAMRGDRFGLVPWLLAGTRHLRTDLTIRDMLDLGLAAPRVDPSRVRNAVVPGRVGSAGGRSVVHLGDPARAMFLDLARDGVLGR